MKNMWNKIYPIVLAVAVLITGWLTYYASGWLGSIGNPKIAAEQYNHYWTLSSTALWISFILLLIAANAVLWTTRKTWALWASLAFFAVFVILQNFVLSTQFTHFEKANNMTESSFTITPLIGVFLCIIGAIIVYFNQVIVLRMREKVSTKAHPINDIDGDGLPDE